MPGLFRFGLRDDNNYDFSLLSRDHRNNDLAIQNHIKKLNDHVAYLQAFLTNQNSNIKQEVARFDTHGDIVRWMTASEIERELISFKECIDALEPLRTARMRKAYDAILVKMIEHKKNYIAIVDKAWVEATLTLQHAAVSHIPYHSDPGATAVLQNQGFGYFFRPSSVPDNITFTYQVPGERPYSIRVPYKVTDDGLVLDAKIMEEVEQAVKAVDLGLKNKGMPVEKAVIQSTEPKPTAAPKPSAAPQPTSSTALLVGMLNLQIPIPHPKPVDQHLVNKQVEDLKLLIADVASMQKKEASRVVVINRDALLAVRPSEEVGQIYESHFKRLFSDSAKNMAELQKALLSILKASPDYHKALRDLITQGKGKTNLWVHLVSIDPKTKKVSETPTSGMKDLCKILKIEPKTLNKPTAQDQANEGRRPPSPSRK